METAKIEFGSEAVNKNAQILLSGIWYSELPDLLEIKDKLANNIQTVLKKQNETGYSTYKTEQDGFITDFKNVVSPKYLRSPGVEPIIYYTFKKNGALREMQIPNLIHHIGFIYNSLWIFGDLFEKIYLDNAYEEKIANSSSYLVLGEEFYIPVRYDDIEEIEEGIFVSTNNKIHGNVLMESKKRQFDEQAEAYLYSIKLDIESFFPNIYTHYFEKMAHKKLYSDFDEAKKYFEFLDTFHQRINNNQTKGIPAGVFSAHIAAELLMLSVDDEIREKFKEDDMGYIRYVDDLTFFSDSKEKLEDINVEVQQILNQYRLRINGNKTQISQSIYNISLTDIGEICFKLPFLQISDEPNILSQENIITLKKYIAELMQKKEISQIKTVFSLFYKKLKEDKLKIENVEKELLHILLLAVFEEKTITWQVYRIIDWIFDKTKNKVKYQELLIKKLPVVNRIYRDSILQIWHYYVLSKSMNQIEKKQFFENNKQYLQNPILVTMFVEKGNHMNAHIMTYIKENFLKESNTTDWKKRIMYSRWWLPLMKIRMVDVHNYENFLQTSMFPEVLADLMS